MLKAGKENNCKVNYQDYTGDNEENAFAHKCLPFSRYYPEQHDQCQYSSKNIKGQKIYHFDVSVSILDSLTAMIRNNIVVATPTENVSHGSVPEAPGTNTPTTREANIILAPSRKKSEIIFVSSLANINYILIRKSVLSSKKRNNAEYNYPVLPNSSRTLEIRSDDRLEAGEYLADIKMGFGDRRYRKRTTLNIKQKGGFYV